MQTRRVDTVGFDIILEMIDPIADIRQDFAAEDFTGVFEYLLESLFQHIHTVALRQRLDPPASEPGGALLGVEIALEMFGQSRIAHDDAERRLIALAFFIELDRRDEHAFHPAVGGVHGKAAGNGAADVVMVSEHLAEADQPLVVEYRNGGAQIGDMPDAAARIVRIVPEEHVSRMDIVGAEIFEHRLDNRRIGAAGQLAPLGVEQRDPIVVLIADHRRAGGSLDRGLDLELGGADGSVDDFELDRTEGLSRRGA